MRAVFADAQYWIALINSNDQSHKAARAASVRLQNVQIVTTEEVLTEVLAFFGERGSHVRQLAVYAVRNVQANQHINVIPQSSQTFTMGLNFYEARGDKGYSHTDCVSMLTMRERGIREVLTHDEHFAQEGFTRLL